MIFIGVVSGLDVQSQNFGIKGGNVQDRMDSPELCKKKINFRVPRPTSRDLTRMDSPELCKKNQFSGPWTDRSRPD